MLIPYLLSFFYTIVQLLVVLIFLPWVVEIFLKITISFINQLLRMNIRPILEVIIYPGSRLRFAFVKMVLDPHIKEVSIDLSQPHDPNTPASGLTGKYYYRGFGHRFEFFRNNPPDRYMVSLAVMFASYSTIVIMYIWIRFRVEILYTLNYWLSPVVVRFIYTWFLLSLLLGGLPVPEESMAPLNTLLTVNSKEVALTFLNLLAFLIGFSAYSHTPYGNTIVTILFLLLESYIIVSYLLNERKRNKMQDPFSQLDFFMELENARDHLG